MWVSSIFAAVSLIMLLIPSIRRNEVTLSLACVMLFISLWIDKGFGLIIGGFVPNMMNQIRPYWPTRQEAIITLGVWAIGFLVLSFLYKIAITVREESEGVEIEH
jgi:molybdopterin-containing oxidoreductase family membrane subunit